MDLIELCTREEAAAIRDYLVELPSQYWLDRSIVKPNHGVNHEVGQYHSTREGLPEDLQIKLSRITPPALGFTEVDFIVCNRYLPGDFIPPHTDKQPLISMFLLFLDDGHEVFRHYPDGLEGEAITVKDKAGYALCFDGSNMFNYHEVLPVTSPRYTVIFGYR